MKKFFAAAAALLVAGFAFAGDAPKQAPAPAKAPAKAEADCKGGNCVYVARPATLRERRHLVVVEPVKVVEVKKVEVKKVEVKEVKVAECATCTTARPRLLGGRRVRTVAASDCCCN
jgi:hypothetical protein